MEQKELFELISRFEASSLAELELGQGDFLVRMKKGVPQVSAVPTVIPESPKAAEAPEGVSMQSSAQAVRSPIVGVYYAAPSPEDKPYVRVGDRVEKGQVLCLVEAMKMMNELKSPVSGVVKNILGVNGELVEFDELLFEVEPC